MAERIIYKKASGETALRQGEILTNVIQYKPIASEISLNSPDFSYVYSKCENILYTHERYENRSSCVGFRVVCD